MTSIVPRLAACLLTLAGAATAAPLTLQGSGLLTQVDNASAADVDLDPTAAFGLRTVASNAGGQSSTLRADWQDTGSGALFDLDLAQARTGGPQSLAYAHLQTLRFTVGASDIDYALAGTYAALGATGRVAFQVQLFDLTAGASVFREFNESQATADARFVLGALGDADLTDLTEGSLVGTLQAGHSYSFSVQAFVRALGDADAGASASGCVGLALGGVALDAECGVAAELAAASHAVPEPGGLALASLARAGLAAVRRPR